MATDEVEQLLKKLNASVKNPWYHVPQWDSFSKHWYTTHMDKATEPSFPYVLDTQLKPTVWTQAQLFNTMGKILVTKGYADFYACLKALFALDETSRPMPTSKPGVLITGQPGTGASFSMPPSNAE